jgi:hypothetical protein
MVIDGLLKICRIRIGIVEDLDSMVIFPTLVDS